MLSTADSELTALRAAIRRAGRTGGQIWLALALGLGLGFDALAFGPTIADVFREGGLIGLLGMVAFLIWPGFVGIGLAVLPAAVLSLLYRSACAATFRKRLAPLSRDERERLLQPMADDVLPEVREIARLLLRKFRAAEVSPAPALGRGDELARA